MKLRTGGREGGRDEGQLFSGWMEGMQKGRKEIFNFIVVRVSASAPAHC